MSAPDQVDPEGLRQRNVPVQANSSNEARKAVLQLNALENETNKMDSDKKTFGRTPDGTGKNQCLLCWSNLPSFSPDYRSLSSLSSTS